MTSAHSCSLGSMSSAAWRWVCHANEFQFRPFATSEDSSKKKKPTTQQDVVKASLCNIFSPSGPEWVTSGKQKMGALKPFLKQGSKWLALGWKQEWSVVVSTSMWTGATLIPLSLNHTAGWDMCIFLVLAITYPNSPNEQLPTRWRAGHTAVAEALLDKEHISTWVLQLNWVHC